MIYYKTPITPGQPLDIPVGAVLACSYARDGFLYGAFYKFPAPGNGWRVITLEEFEAHKPEFAIPASAPTPDEDRDAMLIDLEYRLTLLELEV